LIIWAIYRIVLSAMYGPLDPNLSGPFEKRRPR
jgi:hypothetical protein